MSAGEPGSFHCHRCGKDGSRLTQPPWPGALGRRVVDEICTACWDEWLAVQTRIINEYRLNVLEPGTAAAIKEQMQIFLGFKPPPPAAAE